MPNADLERIIKIIFEGDDKQAADAINRITSSLSTLEGAAGVVIDPLAGLADSVLKADAALAALVAGSLAMAINESGKFGDSFNEISTLINASSEDVGKFRQDTLDYARDSRASLEDINGAIYAAISAGAKYEDSLGLLHASEQLSIAGRAGLKESIVLLMGTLNAYREKTDQATHYSDVFFQTVKLGQTTLPELAASLSKVTGLASSAGIPIETLAAAIATLTASGMPTAEAITGIKAAISNIIKPTGEAEKAAEALGIQFNASSLKTKGFEGVLKDVYTATGGDIEKMGALFGSVEGLNSVMILGSQLNGKFKDSLVAMKDAAGSTETAYAKMADNFKENNNNLANNWKVTLVEIGDEVKGSYGEITGGMGDILKAIGTMVEDGTFDPILTRLRDFTSQLGEYLSGIADALPEAMQHVDFSPFLDALGSLGDTLGGFFGDLDLTKPEDLAKGLQTVVDAVTGLIRITDGMAEAFQPFFSQVVDFLVEVANSDEELQKTIGNILGFSKLISETSLAVVAALSAMQQAGVGLAPTFNVLSGSLQVMFNGAQVAVDGFGLALATAWLGFAQLMNALSFGMSDVYLQQLTEAKASVQSWTDSLVRDGEDAGRGLDRIAAGFGLVESAAGVAKPKIDATAKSLTDIPDKKEIAITVPDLDSMRATLAAFGIDIDKIPQEKLVALKAITDDAAYNAAVEQLMADFPTEKSISLRAAIDGNSMAEAQGELNRFADLGLTVTVDDSGLVTITNELAGKKDLNITAKVDKAKAETDVKKMADAAKELQKSVEWRAKLDIADVEANAKIVEAAFSSLSSTFGASTNHASSLMKEWSDAQGKNEDIWSGDVFKSNQLTDMMESEERNRQSMLSQQRDLTAAEIDYMRARTTALAHGDALIKIDGSGLAPHLEAIMWDVLAAIQVRANEDGQSMLLGLS